MSIDLEWNRLDSSLASTLVDLINRQLASTNRLMRRRRADQRFPGADRQVADVRVHVGLHRDQRLVIDAAMAETQLLSVLRPGHPVVLGAVVFEDGVGGVVGV